MAWFLKLEFRKADQVVASETVSVNRADYGVLPDADQEAGLDLAGKGRDLLIQWFGTAEQPKPDPDQIRPDDRE